MIVEEEADGLSDYTWGDESEDGGVPRKEISSSIVS